MTRMDLHVHSVHSDGHGDYAEIWEQAQRAGLEIVAVTDHWDPYQQEGRSKMPTIEQILKRPFSCNEDYPRLIIGVETGPIPDPRLCGVPLVIASVHYLPDPTPTKHGEIFNQQYWERYQAEVLKLAGSSLVHILGHITGYLPLAPLLPSGTTFDERRQMERKIRNRYFTKTWYEQVFGRAANSGLAIELHTATRTPEPEYAALAIKLGAKLSIGSDAHTLERVGEIDWALGVLDEIGAKDHNLILV